MPRLLVSVLHSSHSSHVARPEATRSIAQTQKVGAQIIVAQSVVHIDTSRQPYRVILESGLKISTRTIVVATGAQYARLPVGDAETFAGRGIYYNAMYMEAQLCESEEVIVVGGGNSVGQAAVYLSQTSSKVHLFVRSGRVSESMSRYLIGRIEAKPNIAIHYQTTMTGLAGMVHLEKVEWHNTATGETVAGAIRHVFVMAGASPRTEWLEESLALDSKGFILTGTDLDCEPDSGCWPLIRPPMLLERVCPASMRMVDG